MSPDPHESPSEHHRENDEAAPRPTDDGGRPEPNSPEAWAEVLATADKYY